MVANEKRCEEGGGSLRKSKKCKGMRKVLAEAASTEEVEMALVGERAVGSSHQRKVADALIQVFEKWIGNLLKAIRTSLAEIQDAINANTPSVRK